MKSLYFLIFLPAISWAQKPEYAVALIPPGMKEAANAVVRDQRTEIDISSRKSMTIKTYRAITVLNEYGNDYIGASETETVRSVSATVYDASGNEIKKIRRKDFRDQALDGSAMISDARLVYLDYTPVQYPYTLVYESEVTSRNTAFIPPWSPVSAKLEAVEKSSLAITCPKELGLRYKCYNCDGKIASLTAPDGRLSFSISDFPPIKSEQFSPPARQLAPLVMFGLEKFSLEGVDGEASSWETFGKWDFSDFMSGTDELSPQTQAAVRMMTADEPDPLKKARIVYAYMQGKTRYVSIQLGIGGWKPMMAKDVDRLGYGDCKALSNYMRALLEVAGVPSYCAIIFGGPRKENLREDFVSMQGNHMILAIPHDDRLTWLECTNQSMPFGYLGDFTDDRTALLLKPEGGQLVHTTAYDDAANIEETTGQYSVDASGAMKAAISKNSSGIVYDRKLPLYLASPEKRIEHYKDVFSEINNLKFDKIELANDQEKPLITESLSMQAQDYARNMGGELVFAVNLDPFSLSPQRYRPRTTPFEIERGYTDKQDIVIEIPDGYKIESMPQPLAFTETFGRYKSEYVPIDARHVRCKREMTLGHGKYASEEYEPFRSFCDKASRGDHAKIVLSKI